MIKSIFGGGDGGVGVIVCSGSVSVLKGRFLL